MTVEPRHVTMGGNDHTNTSRVKSDMHSTLYTMQSTAQLLTQPQLLEIAHGSEHEPFIVALCNCSDTRITA
jgi:hypothetical protein